MIGEYLNKGVCSHKTIVELDDEHRIVKVSILGGCNGNLQGIAALLKGMKAEDAIERIEGIRCGGKATSCPDQIAKALREALNKNNHI